MADADGIILAEPEDGALVLQIQGDLQDGLREKSLRDRCIVIVGGHR